MVSTWYADTNRQDYKDMQNKDLINVCMVQYKLFYRMLLVNAAVATVTMALPLPSSVMIAMPVNRCHTLLTPPLWYPGQQNLYTDTISNTSPSIGTWTISSVTINAAGDTNNGIATTPVTPRCQVSQTKGSTTNYQALLVFVPLFVMSLIANVILTLTIILKKKKATEHTLAKKCEMEDNPCYGPIKKTRSSDNNTDLHVYDTVQGGN